VLRGGGEDAAYLRAVILETPDQIERFVGGNSAADDQQNALVAGCSGWRLALRGPRRRLELFEDFVAGAFRRLPQDDADFVFHGAIVAGGAQPQQLLQPIVELPDGETRHGGSRVIPTR